MFHEKGFTLVETIITLSILSILLLLPFISFPSTLTNDSQAALTAKQLKEDLLLAQHVAMSTGKQTFFRIDNAKKEYVIRFTITDIYLERAYSSEDMFIELITLEQSSLSFLANGHPSRSGSFILHVGDSRYRFTIYLGKGMIHYRKL